MVQLQTAVFGGGCFWCTEAIFQELKGVVSVMPGYAGGSKENPTYEEVSTGKTGHAEVTKVEFDPAHITYNDLLTVFFATHDPTTMNRQGNDIDPQYRSIILYTGDEQKKESEEFIKKLNASDPRGLSTGSGQAQIVTELKPLEKFYEAEDYHKNYYKNNSFQPYCQVIINPKLKKVQKEFAALLKSHEK